MMPPRLVGAVGSSPTLDHPYRPHAGHLARVPFPPHVVVTRAAKATDIPEVAADNE